MKKKIVAIMLATSMVISMAGCGKDTAGNASDNTEVSDSTATTDASDSTEAAEETIEYNVDDYVTLGEYKGLAVTVDGDYEVTDQDVQDAINEACESYPAYETSDKTTVESGDYVNIDYEGLLDGEAFDGGTATGYDLQIGSGTFIDGFEDGLIGATVGTTVALNLTFPDDYTNNTDLAGKDVVFNVTINSIETQVDMSYDTLTDDYVSTNFSYDTVDAYIAAEKESLESTAASTKESDTRTAIINQIVANATISSLPDGLLDQRVNKYISQFSDMCDSYSVDMEDYLSSYYGMTVDDFTTQVTSYMEESLNSELVFEAIAKAEGIEADEEGFATYVQQCMTNYGYSDEDSLFEAYGEDYLRSVYVYNEALEAIEEETTVTYTDTAAEDATEDTTATDSSDAAESTNE